MAVAELELEVSSAWLPLKRLAMMSQFTMISAPEEHVAPVSPYYLCNGKRTNPNSDLQAHEYVRKGNPKGEPRTFAALPFIVEARLYNHVSFQHA